MRLEGRPSGVAVAMHIALGSGTCAKLAAWLNLQQHVKQALLQEHLFGNTVANCARMMHYTKHTQHACDHNAWALQNHCASAT